MEKVIFKLKEPQKGIPKSKQIPTPVNMFFSFGYYEITRDNKRKYIPLKYATGMSITPCYWNDNPEYRAKQTKEFAYESFNTKLENLRNSVIDLKRKFENSGQLPSPGKLREELDKKHGKGTVVHQMSFLGFIEQFIKENQEGKRFGKKGKLFSKATITSYTSTLKHLMNHQDSTRKRIDFDQINMRFYKDFVSYLQRKDYMPNTIGKYIKNIKVFLKEANKRGLTANESYKDEDFIVFQEDTDHVYLSESELRTLFELDLNLNKRLEKVRDLFLFACYTGLRFSDITQIQKEHFIDNNSRIKIHTIKTGEAVEIPVHWIVKQLFEKYGGEIPSSISNQKLNKYLKELCELAEIDEPIISVRTKGGLRYEEKVPKFSQVTVHTARRSFATNMFLAEVHPLKIMKITGHRTEKAFLRYIRISQEDNAKGLANILTSKKIRI